MTKTNTYFCLLLILVLVGALLLRLSHPDKRPLHTDEAVHAYKLGEHLEGTPYRYDPYEFHGPALHYFTLPVARLNSADTFADLDEFTLRIIPALFGAALILMLWPLAGGLGRIAALAAALFTAISPAMVFYSRYYIMEMLLVFFSFALILSVWRYCRSQKPLRKSFWAVIAGAALGLMIASKETWIIAFGSQALALLLIYFWQNKTSGSPTKFSTLARPAHCLVAAMVALAIWVLFFSSFFTNLPGLGDSLRTYTTYFDRAGNSSPHLHNWNYYFKLLLWYKIAPGPVWSEALIFVLALLGSFAAVQGKTISGDRSLVRFILLYTLAMLLIYTAIPYKTPWCLLGFWHGLIILAGIGTEWLIRTVPTRPLKIIVSIALLTGAGNLLQQCLRTNFRFDADYRNPYVYAHSVSGVVRLGERTEQIAQLHPDRFNMRIFVIAPPDDYWPLPWYFRKFNRDNLGYFDQIPDKLDAPVVICSVENQPAVAEMLQNSYQVDVYGLRPDVRLYMYIRRDLWDAFMKNRQ